MDHIAIMKKSWKFTDMILKGKKTIESRWYASKRTPWDKIKAGEWVYFKDSSEPVTIRAKVKKVMQFSGLTPQKVRELSKEYCNDIGVEDKYINDFADYYIDKKYCILIFLESPEKVRPFEIDKTGFGLMSAWISISDINNIKKTAD